MNGARERGAVVRAEQRALLREVVAQAHEILDGSGLSRRVLRAMLRVPREAYVPDAESDLAYINRPLPIGHGQTISQPLIVAVMTQLLGVGSGDTVLEVGTGSGYQAAVLAEIVRQVYSVEVIPELARTAAARLAAQGYSNVEVRAGDGGAGWPEHAPYDGIIVTAAAARTPPALVQQLRAGGRLVIPVGEQFEVQWLMVLHKDEDGSTRRDRVLPVRFVPLVGG